MKRPALLLGAMIFAISGALMAQSPNTSSPGQTANPQPNTANNDLANPGNPQNIHSTAVVAQTSDPATQPTDTTAQPSTTGTQGNGVTGGTTDTQSSASQGANSTDQTGMAGTSQNVTSPPSSGETATGARSSTLPATGSDMPLVGLLGLAALGSGLALRSRLG